jgi:mannosyltransferase OCH1-like enzyme
MMCWDESNIDFSIPMIQTAYQRKEWAKVADVVRLLAVAKYGGVYLDTDFKVFKPLDRLLVHNCFYGFQVETASPDWVANGAFGAIPEHWFIQEALTRVLAIRRKPFGLNRPTEFGPKLITALLRKYGLHDYSRNGLYVRDVFLVPTPVFYPFAWNEQFNERCITDQTLAAHFWAESEGREPSWVSSLPAFLRMARRARIAIRKLGHRETKAK